MIKCKHWSDCGIEGGGCCALNKYGGRPSHGTCKLCLTPAKTPREQSIINKAIRASQAILSRKTVSLEILQERVSTCTNCQFFKDEKCSICGCGVSGDDKKVFNLAKYEENLPKWGCKHPYRKAGEGWKR